jgi:hypothetical protein
MATRFWEILEHLLDDTNTTQVRVGYVVVTEREFISLWQVLVKDVSWI